MAELSITGDSGDKIKNCQSQFEQVMPPKPWSDQTPVTAFKPLVDLIDSQTQSVLFRHEGAKYSQNEDYYDIAQTLDAEGKSSATVKFDNGVTAEVHQIQSWPTQLIIEDKDAGLKETVDLSATSHRIESDKVEYCGVSRLRKFGEHGETYRAYNFGGGQVESDGGLPVLKVE